MTSISSLYFVNKTSEEAPVIHLVDLWTTCYAQYAFSRVRSSTSQSSMDMVLVAEIA